MNVPPRKKNAVPESTATAAGSELPNALRKPAAKGFVRDESPKPDEQAMPSASAIRQIGELRAAADDDIASGRGLTYEWEFVAAQIIDRVEVVEKTTAYTHTQSVAASSWLISHNMATKPGILVVANDGQELLAEVHYPNDNQTVIVFGSPFAGTAYLRG